MQNTESNRVEYKSEITEDFEKEVIAFLNYREGGNIYIGIDKTGQVIDLDNIDNIQLRIKDKIINNICPSTLGLFDVIVEEIDQKKVVKVVISSGTEKPYYLKNKGMTPQGCYIRIGSAKQPMTQAMIDDLYTKRTRNSLKNLESPRQDLTFKQLKIYYEGHELMLNDNFAKNLELLTEDGKYNYNAYLLADDNNVSIKVIKYLGETKNELLENQEYGNKCIITTTNMILDKFNVENKIFAKIGYPTRKEIQMVDTRAFREAVINAIVHNDYSYGGTPIIEFYSNRVEITSTGGLPLGLSQEEFLKGITLPRNQELIRIFKDVELIENIGSGVLRILKEYDENCFDFMEHFLRVSFKYRENTFEYDTEKSEQEKTNKKTEQEKPNKKENKLSLVLEYCIEPKSVKEIMEYIGIKHRPTFIYSYLNPLIEEKKIEMTIPEQPKNRNQKYVTKK